MQINDSLINRDMSLRAGDAYKKASVKISAADDKSSMMKDKIELSDDAKEMLNNENNISAGKPYDLKRILELHNKKNRTMAEAIEEREARKADPKLDAALYAQDKAEALDFVAKVQEILMKAMSGKELTPEEKEIVNEDPLLSSMI